MISCDTCIYAMISVNDCFPDFGIKKEVDIETNIAIEGGGGRGGGGANKKNIECSFFHHVLLSGGLINEH